MRNFGILQRINNFICISNDAVYKIDKTNDDLFDFYDEVGLSGADNLIKKNMKLLEESNASKKTESTSTNDSEKTNDYNSLCTLVSSATETRYIKHRAIKVKQLLKNNPALLNKPNVDGDTPLHQLIKFHFSLDSRKEYDNIKADNLQVLNIIISFFPDIFLKNNEEKSVMMLIREHNLPEITEPLQEYSINNFPKTQRKNKINFNDSSIKEPEQKMKLVFAKNNLPEMIVYSKSHAYKDMNLLHDNTDSPEKIAKEKSSLFFECREKCIPRNNNGDYFLFDI